MPLIRLDTSRANPVAAWARRLALEVWLLGVLLLGFALVPTAARAQSQSAGSSALQPGALLRAGLQIEPDESDRNSGFTIFDAQASLRGDVGGVFSYFTRVDVDFDDPTIRLLDARFDATIIPEARIGVGLFRPAFGLEALTDEVDFTFARRSQASEAIAPGRQVGAELFGDALEGRLTYGAGMSNGNGPTLENDDNRFLYAARAQFNTIGPIEFYDEMVLQFGASVAYSKDTDAELGPGLITPPPTPDLFPIFEPTGFAGERFLWGVDFHSTYRGFALTAEYLSGNFDPEEQGGPEIDGQRAYGGYVEAGWRGLGLFEGVVRYDGFHPVEGENRDYLVFGVNIFPGSYAKMFGIQYAVKLHGSPPAPTIAGNQLILLGQIDF